MEPISALMTLRVIFMRENYRIISRHALIGVNIRARRREARLSAFSTAYYAVLIHVKAAFCRRFNMKNIKIRDKDPIMNIANGG